MKIVLYAVLALIVIVVLAGAICYAIGARLPLNHATTVTGTVEAPPAKVFAIITNIADGPSWRKQVKSVQVLPPDAGRDHWVEDLGHGQKMSFLATHTEPPTPDGHALREVLLDVPGASYGGTWTYKLSPGPNPTQTSLSITETGFINPPLYRFMMAHVIGMTSNLDQYLHDIQAAAAKP
jgi:hypothetical protein